MITSQVKEVGFLVEFVKDGTRAVFDIRRSEDGDTVLGESFGEVRAALVIFEGRDSRSHCDGEE